MSSNQSKGTARIILNSKWNNLAPQIIQERIARIKTPIDNRKNILITSALPYVNNVPHLGNIIGCVLSADVFSRFCRLRNYNSLFICGTDEYGTATETKAIEENMTPQEICDKYHKLHASVYEWFQIDFDFFGRTTTPLQTEIAQNIFKDLYDRDLLLSDQVEQLYCENCTRYLADRFVYGICPFCSYNDARGDQCDKCGKLINAVELKEPVCKLCKSKPVRKTSKHLFLNLPKLEDDVKKWSNNSMDSGVWTDCSKSITTTWIRDGLKPRCITRDLKWGTKVPLDGYEDKVFYVWFDAPIGYISITANCVNDWKQWWMNPENVKLVQFMAKDNVPFHTIIFPCSLIGTGKNYTLPNDISAIEYLNYENDKFSKSRGIGVFGDNAQKSGISSDVFRFYLILSRPETQDTNFCWNDLQLRYNGDIINNLGNFVNRTLQFMKTNFSSKVPKPSFQYTDEDREFISEVNKHLNNFNDSMEKERLRDGLRSVLEISRCGNQHLQRTEPWKLIKSSSDISRAQDILYILAQLVALICPLLNPFMPSASLDIAKFLNISLEKMVIVDEFIPYLPVDHHIGEIKPLFTKIEDITIKQLKNMYSNHKTVETKTSDVKQNSAHMDEICDNLEALELKITKQADHVRNLKKSSTDKQIIKEEVEILLKLKSQKECILKK